MHGTVPGIELLQRYPVQLLETRGVRFSYREAGKGPVLMLLHGIGSGSGSWPHQLAGLSDRFRVVAWDAPGYGDSSAPMQAEPDARSYADALGRFLDALKITRCFLLGHSLGALMAASFAAARPEAVERLMLSDPAGGYGDAEPAVRDKRMARRLEMMAMLGPAGVAEQRAAAVLAEGANANAIALVGWNMSRLHPDGYRQAVWMLGHGRLTADAGAYSGPVLVLCGGEDSITPPEGCRAIADAYSDARYVEIAGAGHMPYLEKPVVFNRTVRGFAGGDA